MKRLTSSFLAAAIFCGLPWAAQAEAPERKRALLVGVSEYPLLSGKNLKGPKEDIRRMRDELGRRGFSAADMVVLTEGGPANLLPTRQRILAELGRLADTARAGDHVVIMMAGHGSRSPVPAGSPHLRDEPDGLYEIFLPRDVSGWDDRADEGRGDVVNAIKDHEIRALVDRMVARGAFVWALFDACHSATLVRGGDVTMRQIEPSDLRIPQRRLDAVAGPLPGAGVGPAPVTRPSPAAGAGRAVYFYAAQSTQLAPEMPLPRGVAGSPVHGLFSYSVIKALESGVPMTYRQLMQQVTLQYAGNFEARGVSPAFSGDGLDTPVLGTRAAVVRQWPLAGGVPASPPQPVLRAGLLSDIHPGSVFALLRDALDPIDKALGHAVVSASSAHEARLLVSDAAGQPKSPEAALPEGARVARLTRSMPGFELSVATDLARCASPCPFEAPIRELKANRVPGAVVRWVDGRHGADLALRADGRRLWLLPAGLDPLAACREAAGAAATRCLRDAQASHPYIDVDRSANPQRIREAIGVSLHGAARATNLLRLAQQEVANSSAARLSVTLSEQPGGGAQAGCRPSGARDLSAGGTVRQGTCLRVGFRGDTGTRTPLDVSVLYVDSKFGISPLWPALGEYNRIDASAKEVVIELSVDASDRNPNATIGPENLIFIAVEATPHTAPAEFSFLAQSPPEFEGSVTTRGFNPYRDFFGDAGFADFQTRGMNRATIPPGIRMQVMPLKVTP